MTSPTTIIYATTHEMDALAAYGSSDEGSGPEETHDEPSIDPEESSSVLHELKEKFPLNSAPSVPKRVSGVRLMGAY